jgi:hypothetical protein
MEKKKDTIGQQIIDVVKKSGKDKGPEAREVTLEWGKNFLKELENIARDPQYKKWDLIYIKVLAKKQVASENMVNVVYGVTNVMPSPDWKNMLYSYDRKKDEWKLHWVLPQAPEIARVMLAHEDGFDPILISSIKKFLNGELPGQAL